MPIMAASTLAAYRFSRFSSRYYFVSIELLADSGTVLRSVLTEHPGLALLELAQYPLGSLDHGFEYPNDSWNSLRQHVATLLKRHLGVGRSLTMTVATLTSLRLASLTNSPVRARVRKGEIVVA
jgi:hypothetical protein